EVALHRRRALVLGPVVDHHHVGAGVVVAGEALEARHELVHPVPGEDEDDDARLRRCRHLGHVLLSRCDGLPIATAVNSAPRSAGPPPGGAGARDVLGGVTPPYAPPPSAPAAAAAGGEPPAAPPPPHRLATP